MSSTGCSASPGGLTAGWALSTSNLSLSHPQNPASADLAGTDLGTNSQRIPGVTAHVSAAALSPARPRQQLRSRSCFQVNKEFAPEKPRPPARWALQDTNRIHTHTCSLSRFGVCLERVDTSTAFSAAVGKSWGLWRVSLCLELQQHHLAHTPGPAPASGTALQSLFIPGCRAH